MFQKFFFYILSLLIVLGFVIGHYFGPSIPYASQEELLGGLRDTSAVLMAVLGVWLAVMCPEVLPKLFSGKPIKLEQELIDRIQALTVPLMIYSIIICFEILIPWIALITKQIPLLVKHSSLMREISFGLISSLCIVQVLSLLIVLVPVELVDASAKINSIRSRFLNR